MQKLFSFVIPMYNVSDYILKSIRSIEDQGMDTTEFEIVVVDDHSTDDSYSIVDEYRKTRPYIKLVTNPDKGVSSSRNFGVSQTGDFKYLWYLDADDYLAKDKAKKVAELMDKDNLDILSFSFLYADEDGRLYKDNFQKKIEETPQYIMSGREYIIKHYERYMVWLYVYRLDFIKRIGVDMIEVPHEDVDYPPRVIARAGRIRFEPLDAVCYLQRASSFMNAYKPDNLYGILKCAINTRNDILTNFPDDKELIAAIENRTRYLTLFTIKKSIRERLGNERELIKYCHAHGLLPIENDVKSFKRYLLNNYPGAYIAFYRFLDRKRKD